ncbi:arsenate reductase family protein [Lysobacter sp. TY2-98]|uniref:arsenate reductase family protein n=1 Tax=Lysobacter sp. TY2-98 TaxID=2290922 RepID=UPI000E1FFA28|nr:arsenate reductase family protein [Lysobacter sp. TY2-98]AXK71654.1 arsenate reductase family protein [Lysobacter sp. TY2-98]
MSDRPVLFHNKSTCSKCAGALEMLKFNGIEPDVVDIKQQPLDEARLREIVRMTGGPVRALVRSGEAAYAAAGLDESSSDDALIAAMATHPELVERPIVVHNGRAVVGRPPERVLELFDLG